MKTTPDRKPPQGGSGTAPVIDDDARRRHIASFIHHCIVNKKKSCVTSFEIMKEMGISKVSIVHGLTDHPWFLKIKGRNGGVTLSEQGLKEHQEYNGKTTTVRMEDKRKKTFNNPEQVFGADGPDYKEDYDAYLHGTEGRSAEEDFRRDRGDED